MNEQSYLPHRVVVGQNGAYWRDFGDGYSMCIVSTDNDPVVPGAVYERIPAGSVILTAEQVDSLRRQMDVSALARKGTSAMAHYHAGRDTALRQVLTMIDGKEDRT